MRNPWWVQIEQLETPLRRFLFSSRNAARMFCERWVGQAGTRSALLYSQKAKKYVARYVVDPVPRWEPAGGSSGHPEIALSQASPAWTKKPGAPIGPRRRQRRVSRSTLAVFTMLWWMARRRRVEGVTVKQLAAQAHVSERSAQMALRKLERQGVIRTKAIPGKPAAYQLLYPPAARR